MKFTSLKSIRIIGERATRDPLRPLKKRAEAPIRVVSNIFTAPWKEVRMMEVGGLTVKPTNLADQMKTIRKVRLQRQVLEHPELARKLVRVENSGIYNAKGEVIQAVGELGAA